MSLHFLSPEQKKDLEMAIRGGRIIATAMIAGMLLIAIIFAFLIEKNYSNAIQLDVLTYISIFFLLTLLPLSAFSLKLISKKLSANSGFPEILQTYRAGLIVSLTLPEAASILALASAFVQRQLFPEYLFVAVCAIVMVKNWPNQDKFSSFFREVQSRQRQS